MDLIIKNFDKFSKEAQEDIQDFIAGHTPEFILVDQLGELRKWARAISEKEDFKPTHIDLEKVLDLLERGEIRDPSLTLDPKQKTLKEVFGK